MTKELIIKNLVSILSKHINFNSSNDHVIISISDDEFQLQDEGSMPCLYYSEDFNEIANSINRIVDYMYHDEERSFMEMEDDDNIMPHIFTDVKLLKEVFSQK